MKLVSNRFTNPLKFWARIYTGIALKGLINIAGQIHIWSTI